jgi:hypothetical protein
MAEGRARMVVGSFPGGNATYSLRSCMLARPALCLIYAHLQPFEKFSSQEPSSFILALDISIVSYP